MKSLALGLSLLLYLLPVSHAETITTSAFPSPSAPANELIDEFHEVNANIFRGARPDYEGLNALRQMGIKTDLNLDNDDEANLYEESYAKSLGIRYLAHPLSGFFAPSDSEVEAILTQLADPANYPIFIHCKHGQDRTGLIVGLYRVFNENWEPTTAYREMLEFNFHPSLFLLDRYFHTRTGWSGELEIRTNALDQPDV